MSGVERREKLRDRLQKGIRHFRTAEYKLCAEEMKRALELDSDDLTAKQYLADLHEINNTLLKAVRDYNAQDYQACMAAVQRVLELNPADPNAASLSAKLPMLMQGDGSTPPTASAVGLAPVWTSQATGSASGSFPHPALQDAEQRAATQRRRVKLILLIVGGLVLVQIPVLLFVVRGRKAAKAPVHEKVALPTPAPVDALELADRALEMVKANRFAMALGLLQAAQTHAKGDPIKAATLLEREVKVRMAMGTRLAAAGNEVAAKVEFERVLQLSPGQAEATKGLVAIKTKEKKGRLAGTKLVAETPVLPKAPRPAARRRPARRWQPRAAKPKKKVAMAEVPVAPAQGSLFVVSKPAGAIVRVDGARIGMTPLRDHKVSLGSHTITVEARGFKSARRTVAAKSNQAVFVDVELAAVAPTPVKVERPRPAVVEPPPPKPVAKPLTIPSLRLPKKLVVPVFKSSGKRASAVRAVCIGVERTVTKALGRSAAGTTSALQEYIYKHSGPGAQVTLYPRAMGYLIAQALANKSGGIRGRLVSHHKSGKLASLINWRP